MGKEQPIYIDYLTDKSKGNWHKTENIFKAAQ